MTLSRSGDPINAQKLPKNVLDAGMLYVRTMEVRRVVESVQQILYYPLSTNRTSARWDIAMRSRAEETLFPNTKSCARLAELTGAFSQAAAGVDSINATLAHGPDTRLPDEFYDKRVCKVIDRIVVGEMFRGYGISRELRMLA